jgi:hypothetical protein
MSDAPGDSNVREREKEDAAARCAHHVVDSCVSPAQQPTVEEIASAAAAKGDSEPVSAELKAIFHPYGRKEEKSFFFFFFFFFFFCFFFLLFL